MSPDRDIDIVILTVLNEEYNAVRSRLRNTVLARISGPSPSLFAEVIGEVEEASTGRSYTVLLAMIGRAGTSQGAVAAQHIIDRWRPRYVLFVGIAGGFERQNLALGDVVLADIVRGYEYGKIEQKFIPRHDWTYRADVGLVNAADVFGSSDTNWISEINFVPPSPVMPKGLRGQIASGDKVVDDPTNSFFQQAIAEWPKLLAIEMEGAGVAVAIEASQSLGQAVGFLMIRGISDMPRPNTGENIRGTAERDAWKLYAANAAAAFAVGFIARGFPVSPLTPSELTKTELPRLEINRNIQPSPPSVSDLAAGAKNSWFIRLKVTNAGIAPAVNAIGRLLYVLNESGEYLEKFAGLDLYWTRQDKPERFHPVTISGGGDFTYLDIAQVKEAENILTLRVVVPEGHRLVQTEGLPPGANLPPGLYYMQIGIFADNVHMQPMWFKIQWSDRDYSSLPCHIEEAANKHIEELLSRNAKLSNEPNFQSKTGTGNNEPVLEVTPKHSIVNDFQQPATPIYHIAHPSQSEIDIIRQQLVSEVIPGFIQSLLAIEQRALLNRNASLGEERFHRLSQKINQYLETHLSQREAQRFHSRVHGSMVVYRDPLKDLHENHIMPAVNFLIALGEAIEAGDVKLAIES